MRCDKYVVRMTLSKEEITMLMTAVCGYKGVVSKHSRNLLEGIEELLKYQIARQDREILEEKRKNRKNA